MGQSQSAWSVGKHECLSHVELVFAARTMGTALNASSGSRPSVVSRSLHNTTLKVRAVERDLPVTGDRPEEAIRLLLNCIQALPGIDPEPWTAQGFLEHVSTIELIESSTLTVKSNEVQRSGTGVMFVRVHYEEKESVLQALLGFFSARMSAAGSSVINVRPRGYEDLVAQISFNFLPNEVNITSESELLAMSCKRAGATGTVSKTLGAIGDTGTMMNSASDIAQKVLKLGGTLKHGIETLAPILKSQGVTVPDMMGSSPTNIEDLVKLLDKYEPAMKMIQKLGKPS